MSIPRCNQCGANLEEVRMPNGGYVLCNTVPGLLLEDPDGPDKALDPRSLKTLTGKLLHFTDARRAQQGGAKVLRVWVRHRCPQRRQDPAAPPVKAPEPEPEQPQETQQQMF